MSASKSSRQWEQYGLAPSGIQCGGCMDEHAQSCTAIPLAQHRACAWTIEPEPLEEKTARTGRRQSNRINFGAHDNQPAQPLLGRAEHFPHACFSPPSWRIVPCVNQCNQQEIKRPGAKHRCHFYWSASFYMHVTRESGCVLAACRNTNFVRPPHARLNKAIAWNTAGGVRSLSRSRCRA